MAVAWLANPALKAAALGEVRGHRAAGTLSRRRDHPVRSSADGRFQGGFHACLTARRLADDRGIPVALLLEDGGENVPWLDESERLWGLPRIAGALLDRCFEWLPATEAGDFAVAALQAIPVSANLDQVGARWMLDVLAEEHNGVLTWTTVDTPTHEAVQRVATLYQRRLAGEQVNTEEWAVAAKQARAVSAQAYAVEPRGIDAPAAATAHAAVAAYAPDALPAEVRLAAAKASLGLANGEAAAYQAAYIETEAIAQAAHYAVNAIEAVADADFHLAFAPIREAAERGQAALNAGQTPTPADAAAIELAHQAGDAGVARRTEYHRWRARQLNHHLNNAT